MTREGESARPARRTWPGQVLGLVIAVACIAFVATHIDFSALGKAVTRFHWPWLAAGLASLAIGYAARIARWAYMLRAGGARVGTMACVAPFLGSIALNNVLPLRAGDVMRALVFPTRLGVPRTTSTASLLLERLIDLVALVLCLGIGLWLLGPAVELSPAVRSVAATLATAGAVGLLALVALAPAIARGLDRLAGTTETRGTVGRIAAVASALTHRIAAMSRPATLVGLALFSIPVWIGESGLFLCLLYGLDIPVGFSAGLTVMAVTTLSTLVPSTPGYVGPFHLAAFGAVTMLGVDTNQAGAYALLTHFALWASTTLAGAVAIATHRNLFAQRAAFEADDLRAS